MAEDPRQHMTTNPEPPPHCLQCGQILNLIPRLHGGGRERLYCNNACRQRAYRLRVKKRKRRAPQPDHLVQCSCGMGNATMPGDLHHYDCPLRGEP
jgi:hypothetical protein